MNEPTNFRKIRFYHQIFSIRSASDWMVTTDTKNPTEDKDVSRSDFSTEEINDGELFTAKCCNINRLQLRLLLRGHYLAHAYGYTQTTKSTASLHTPSHSLSVIQINLTMMLDFYTSLTITYINTKPNS